MYLSKNHVKYCSLEGVSLGCHCEGYSMPVPNSRDSVNFEHGAKKRVGAQMPPIDPAVLLRFSAFVMGVLLKYLDPLRPSDVLSFEDWLSQTDYNENRKKELRSAFAKCIYGLWYIYYVVKSHLKVERLDEFKFARIINSRCDVFKVYVAPVFHAIEEYLFHRSPLKRFFVKGLKPAERSKRVYENVYCDGCRYVATDFSSFECGFTREVMNACEIALYDFLTMYLPDPDWIVHVREALTGVNRCKSKLGSFKVEATRMSGDMCTSLGNGFTNLMVSAFVMHESGIPFEELHGCFEGDDGVMAVPHGIVLHSEIYAQLGFKIKLVEHDDLCAASFCGIVFDYQAQDNLVDPDEVIVKFGWSLSSLKWGGDDVLLGLLHAKALSLMYEFPACPIVTALARYGLRVSSGSTPIWDKVDLRWSFVQSDRTFSAPKQVHFNSRLLMAKKWGVSVQRQLEIEAYLDGLNSRVPLPYWFVSSQHYDWYLNYKDHTLVGSRLDCERML
jgi:hypothetical protein